MERKRIAQLSKVGDGNLICSIIGNDSKTSIVLTERQWKNVICFLVNDSYKSLRITETVDIDEFIGEKKKD